MKHPDLWEVRGLAIIKHPWERSLKSCCNLLVVDSGNYYLDRLTADICKENITYDAFNMSYINYNAIFLFSNVSNHEKCNRHVFQNMRSGAVHCNGAQCCMRDFYFCYTLFHPFRKFNKNIYYEGYSKEFSRRIWMWSL